MAKFQQLVNLSEQYYSSNFSITFEISQSNRLGEMGKYLPSRRAFMHIKLIYFFQLSLLFLSV